MSKYKKFEITEDIEAMLFLVFQFDEIAGALTEAIDEYCKQKGYAFDEFDDAVMELIIKNGGRPKKPMLKEETEEDIYKKIENLYEHYPIIKKFMED